MIEYGKQRRTFPARERGHTMKTITLGKTGITTPQNGFGALPIQRVDMDTAVRILNLALDGGMTFFDTARAYSDSEEKLGAAFAGKRDRITLCSKTMAKTPEKFWEDLHTSLTNLKTDHIDIYQFHCVDRCYRPGDGTGMYEAMAEAREKGMIRHIGVTAHKLGVAEELVESGLYETLQFPFSYLASDRDLALVRRCAEQGMGFIAMKGLSGGLLNNSGACMAFMSQFDNVVPIWGVQRESELREWLSYFESTPALTPEYQAIIDADRKELLGDFCRGCGYCAPCTVGIVINQCARMSQMIRRAPSQNWLSPQWQAEMAKIDQCVDCGACMKRCPYELNIPQLLRKNWTDYQEILSGNRKAE